MDIASIRKEYRMKSLHEKDVDADPIKQFEIWWQQAIESEILEPNAMTLATCTADGKPSARIVLLKEIYNNGFVFYTNYESRKGKEINQNPFAAIVFFWKELERQIRIEGEMKKVSNEQSDAYFLSRPLESRVGASISPQSQVISSREVLDKNFIEYSAKYELEEIPRPENWGGYVITPAAIEFWQGRPGRLHDRLRYMMNNNTWKIERLAP